MVLKNTLPHRNNWLIELAAGRSKLGVNGENIFNKRGKRSLSGGDKVYGSIQPADFLNLRFQKRELFYPHRENSFPRYRPLIILPPIPYIGDKYLIHKNQ